MTSPFRSAQSLVRSIIVLPSLLLFAAIIAAPRAYATTATTTTLTLSADHVSYKTPVTLTATVTETVSGAPVTSGLVLFCAVATAATPCETNSPLLAMVQLTAANATAEVKIGSGPQGTHSYKAVYRANSTYDTSTSAIKDYVVQGTYASNTALASSGSAGNYTLASTVTGVGSVGVGPSGSVSFIDTSAGNNGLGTQILGPPVLTNAFTTAPNSPFDIGDNGVAPPTSIKPYRTTAIASAYLNDDDNIDIVTGDADQIISVLLGNGNGTFQAKVNYPGCQVGRAMKILLGDFNRDGTPDVALGCSQIFDGGSSGGVTIILGNGDGSFRTPTFYTTGDVAGLAMGDFNGDGILDLVVSDQSQKDVRIMLGNGNGTFHTPTVIVSPSRLPHDLVVADFNGDGKDDIGIAISASSGGLSDLHVALGNGDGTFQATQIRASSIGEFLTTGDTNSDNKPDIISSTVTIGSGNNHIGNSMFVLIGKGDGTFQSTVTYISDIPSDPHLTDVNGDGKPDIIAGGSYGALVYLGNGNGTFQAYSEPIIGGFNLTYAVNAGDYNNDGNADLVGTDAEHQRAAVALSEVQQSADAVALSGVAVFPLGSGVHNVDAIYSGDQVFTTSTSSTVPLRASPVPTTLTLDVSPSSGTLAGQSVTLTATLDPYSVSGPPSTTSNGNSVTFYNSGTTLGTGTLSGGVATLTTTTLPAGSNALRAVFPGTLDYNSSASSTITVTVSNILLASTPNPSDYKQSVSFTATLPSGDTGTVTFKDGTTTLGTSPVSGTTSSYSTTSLTGGSHSITAVYSGDGSHSAATSPVLTQVVNKITPTVALSSQGQTTYAQSITLTAQLPNDSTGSVTFKSGSLVLGTATLVSGAASLTTTSIPVGNNTITANYSGDGNYNTAVGLMSLSITKASPSSTLTSSANPSTYGASVTFTDTLPSAATGTVTFANGGTTLGTPSLVNGVATLTLSSLAVGNTTITATYNGDGNYNTSVTSLVQAVNKATPTLALTSSANPSLLNQSVTFTATLPTSVTGTVVFSGGGSPLGTVTVANGVATYTTSTLALGTNAISAQYGGDGNYNSANANLTQTVDKANPSVAVTTSGPSTWGSSVTITAIVPSGVTGAINFSTPAGSLGSGTIAGGAVAITTSTLPVGSTTITANYDGDANNNAASGAVVQVVSKASTTSALTSSANPSTIGSSVTFTDTLSPTNATGTVTFANNGSSIGTATVTGGVGTLTLSSLPSGSNSITAAYSGDGNYGGSAASLTQTVNKNSPAVTVTTSGASVFGASVTITAQLPAGVTGNVTFTTPAANLGTATLNGSAIATVSTTTLPVGSTVITATYNGDSSNNTATGTATQVVSKASPSMTLGSSVNPAQAEQPVTFTATLSSTSATGTVAFTSGTTALGTGTVASGVAAITSTALPIGANTITATYTGDTNNDGTTATFTETINKTTPTVTVTTNPNPSTWGGLVTITASVPAGATGTITITSAGNPVGSGTVSAAGTVTVTTSTLPVGTNPIQAAYDGDSNNFSANGIASQVVNKATPSLTVTTSGPSNSGEPVTITTTLPVGTTGAVTITSNGNPVGTGTVNPSTGVATVTTSALPVGSNPITVNYGGDGNNNPASGSTTQVVSKIAPTVSLISSLNPSPYGQSVTFTSTLSSTTPTGTVTFYDGAAVIGTGTLVSGVTSVNAASLATGTHSITATYNGDTNYGTATSAPLSQVVDKLTPTLLPPSVSAPSILSGGSETITETVPSGVSGPVTFYNGGTPIGTAPIVGGVATITVTNLPYGSNPITASTPGDANNNPATSPATTVNVTKSTPTVTLTSSLNPSATSQAVVFTATLPSGVTGTVTFTDGGAPLGTATIVNGQAAITASSLTAGTHTILASYGGDTNYDSANSTPLTQTVNKGNPTLPPPSVSNPAEPYGGTETITETVPPGVSGPVTFYNGADPIGTAPVVNGTATIAVPNLPVGSNPITATTPSDANNNPATSPVTVITITKTTPVLPPPSVSNPNPTPNTPVTITETVPPGVTGPVTFSNGTTPIGTVTVVNGTATITVPSLPIGSNPITASVAETTTSNAATSPATNVTVDKTTPVLPPPSVSNPNPTPNTPVTITETVPPGVTGPVTFSNGTTPIGTVPVVNGTATITVPSLPIGSNPITASVAETTTSNAATSPATNVTVDKTTPVLPPPSVSNPNPTPNTPVTITETVPPGVTGPVTFSNGTTPIGTVPVVNGTATITVPSLPIGSNPITASVAETTTSNAATSPATNVTVDKTTPVLPPPSVSNSSPTPNTPVTITETVPPGVTGPVTFSNGTTPIGTVPVVNGTATITVPSLPIGSNPITASVAETTTSNAATSPATSVTVGKTTPVLPPPSVSNSSPAPNTPVTITETVPTGVTGPVTFMNGTTPLGASPVVNGVATITVPNLPLGSNPITATVAETATSNAATSPATTVMVATGAPTVTLASSANPSALNQTVVFTATVPTAATGIITFQDGSIILGTGAINGGVAVLSTSNLAVGTHTIMASYAGDTAYSSAASAPLTQVVGKLPTTTTISQTAGAQMMNGSVTFSATVSSTSPVPTGTITFLDGTTVLGTVALNTNGGVAVGFQLTGTAAITVSTLTGGSHTITAVYSGDASFLTSTSAPVTNLVHDFTNTNTGAAQQSVMAGTSTDFTFTLAPKGTTTFISDVKLTIDGLPEGTTYSFSPATVASGAGSTAVTLQIKTINKYQARNSDPRHPGSNGTTGIALSLIGLAGLGTARRYRRRMPRMLLGLLLLAGSLLPIAGLSGCAGGYFTLKPTTYTVTVTGTEGAIQRSATATLVVEQ